MSLSRSGSLLRFVVLTAVAACAAPEEQTAESADAVSEDQSATRCSTAEDPAACVGRLAQARLTRTLASVESDLREQGLLEADERGRYRVRTTAACFELTDPGKAKVAWEQVKGAIDFLSEFHRDRRGRGNRWFSDVLVCNAKDVDDATPLRGGLWGGELRLEGSTLQVGVKKGLLGGFKVQNGLELRDRWDAGEHFVKTALDDDKGIFRKKAWPLINPVGVPRTQAVPAIRDAARAFAGVLRGIAKITDAPKQKAELVAAIESNTAVDIEIDGVPFAERAKNAVSGKSPDAIRALLEQWASALSSGDGPDDAYEAVSAIQQGAAGRACNVDVQQVCFVAVNNAHCINVNLSAGASLVSRFLTKESASQNQVRASQFSFVCVQTNDFIDVNVSLGVNRALFSAGLAKALGMV